MEGENSMAIQQEKVRGSTVSPGAMVRKTVPKRGTGKSGFARCVGHWAMSLIGQ